MKPGEHNETYEIEFTDGAISDIVRRVMKELESDRLVRVRGVESEKVDSGFAVKITVIAVKKEPLLTLGKRIQERVFEGVKSAAGIELKKIDVHFEKILEL